MDESRIEKIKERREEDPSIYKKRYYKVILLGIDRARETPESFSIKMAMRLRVPMPRVKQLVAHMPCTVKAGMTVAQANRLRAVIDELGGEVVVEDYYEVPGGRSRSDPAGEESPADKSGAQGRGQMRCPECGWMNDAKDTHCALCLAIFKKERSPESSEGESPPPAEDSMEADVGTPGIPSWVPWLLVGSLLVVILVLLVK